MNRAEESRAELECSHPSPHHIICSFNIPCLGSFSSQFFIFDKKNNDRRMIHHILSGPRSDIRGPIWLQSTAEVLPFNTLLSYLCYIAKLSVTIVDYGTSIA